MFMVQLPSMLFYKILVNFTERAGVFACANKKRAFRVADVKSRTAVLCKFIMVFMTL